MSLYLYKLVPPRPTFPQDMDEAEAAIMQRHFAYWQERVDEGSTLVYGPVADPAGAWGLAILQAESEEAARSAASGDPAVEERLGTCALYELPDAIAAPAALGAV
jgi:uncharacterized protein YciI